MNGLDQYIVTLEQLCGQDISGAQGDFNGFFRAIWLEVVVLFRFICATTGPFLLAFVPAGIAIGIYYIWKYIKKVDKPIKIYHILYRYYDWNLADKRAVFLETKWKNMSDKDKTFLTFHQIPLDINEERFFKLRNEYDEKTNKCYNVMTRVKWIIAIPTLLLYVLAAYPYYLMTGFYVTLAVIIIAGISFVIIDKSFGIL